MGTTEICRRRRALTAAALSFFLPPPSLPPRQINPGSDMQGVRCMQASVCIGPAKAAHFNHGQRCQSHAGWVIARAACAMREPINAAHYHYTPPGSASGPQLTRSIGRSISCAPMRTRHNADKRRVRPKLALRTGRGGGNPTGERRFNEK